MLTLADTLQHGNVQLEVIGCGWFEQSSFAGPLDLLGGHSSTHDYHPSWMGYVVEIRDVSFRSGRANCVPGH
jgi:hypothetical protein